MCECYQVGGRFIAEDPDCKIHNGTSKARVGDYVMRERGVQRVLEITDGQFGLEYELENCEILSNDDFISDDVFLESEIMP